MWRFRDSRVRTLIEHAIKRMTQSCLVQERHLSRNSPEIAGRGCTLCCNAQSAAEDLAYPLNDSRQFLG